jgi:ubiquinone/menaquinone biosynthesis C-methylase UbiE
MSKRQGRHQQRSQRSPADGHYSYTIYADQKMADSFEDRRFGGPIGELVAKTQARVLANMIGRIKDRTIIDVGTGAGRAALMLALGGARVTAVDASEQMLEVARRRAADNGVTVNFQRGDAHALKFGDRTFDVAVCLRVLMHAQEWQQCMSELCRVAERLVIFDYPSATSAAVVQSLTRRAAHAVGLRTEPYRVFTHKIITRELARNNFRIRSVHRQFTMPIQLHRAIGSRRFTLFSEGVLDRAGLLRMFGSPVTVCAERCGSS